MKKTSKKSNKPCVEIDLNGPDGNAFMILSKVQIALKKAGYSARDLQKYSEEAKSGDYENLLKVTRKHVELVEL